MKMIARNRAYQAVSRARIGSLTAAPGVSLGLQAEARAAHGVDQRPGGRLLELAAQIPDVHVDHIRGPAVVLLPHMGEQLCSRNELAWPAEHEREQLELLRRQLDGATCPGDRSRYRIGAELADFDRYGALGRTATDQGAQPGQQLAEVKRLDQV